MTIIAPEIETHRLRLRPYQMSDLDDLLNYRTRPDVTRYVYWEPRNRDEVAAGLSRRTGMRSLEREGDEIVLVAELRETGQTIGDVSLQWISAAHKQAEIGFVFNPDHHGRGYASEAAREMLRIGFERVGFHRIEGRCDARNDASARLMERLGMRREAHFVENEWFKGEWSSELVYAILDREWQGGPDDRHP